MELATVGPAPAGTSGLRLAVLAQDARKQELIGLLRDFLPLIRRSSIVATGGTGALAARWVGLPIAALKSGPLGGYVQVASRVVEGTLDAVIMLCDPHSPRGCDPDAAALLRLCDVYDVPLATNAATARLMLAQFEGDDILNPAHIPAHRAMGCASPGKAAAQGSKGARTVLNGELGND